MVKLDCFLIGFFCFIILYGLKIEGRRLMGDQLLMQPSDSLVNCMEDGECKQVGYRKCVKGFCCTIILPDAASTDRPPPQLFPPTTMSAVSSYSNNNLIVVVTEEGSLKNPASLWATATPRRLGGDDDVINDQNSRGVEWYEEQTDIESIGNGDPAGPDTNTSVEEDDDQSNNKSLENQDDGIVTNATATTTTTTTSMHEEFDERAADSNINHDSEENMKDQLKRPYKNDQVDESGDGDGAYNSIDDDGKGRLDSVNEEGKGTPRKKNKGNKYYGYNMRDNSTREGGWIQIKPGKTKFKAAPMNFENKKIPKPKVDR